MKSRPVVLLVDHKLETRPVFEQAAQTFPFELATAEDGQAGYDVAMEIKPDVIVIRQNAPILNPQSVSILLKQSIETSKIPIIVICTHITDEEKEKFQDAGCDDCIKDPITIDALILKIQEWLSL